jgi:uncharacterized protein with PQ loop repeat
MRAGENKNRIACAVKVLGNPVCCFLPQASFSTLVSKSRTKKQLIFYIPCSIASRTFLIRGAYLTVSGVISLPFTAGFTDAFNYFLSLAGGTYRFLGFL